MKKVIKPTNPKFYLGHYPSNEYKKIECIFDYDKKSYATIYLVRYKEGAKDKYYINEAKKLYKEEIKSKKIIKAIKPHYYRNRNLIIGGSTLVAAGLVTMGVILAVNQPKPLNSAFKYELNEDGTYTINEYKGDDKDLVIPETYNGKRITRIGEKTFWNCEKLETVCLSNNIETIGSFAFAYNPSLVSVTFPETTANAAPALKTISNNAFSDNSKLKNIYLPDSLNTIESYAFQNDSSLEELFIPFHVQTVGDDPFRGCNNLTLYIEKESVPETWSTSWNNSNRPFIMGADRDMSDYLFIDDKIEYLKIASGKNAYLEIIKFNETEGNLPEKLEIKDKVKIDGVDIPVKSINDNAFANASKGNVKWLIIPNSVNYVGKNAFAGLKNVIVFCREGVNKTSWADGWDNGVAKCFDNFTEMYTANGIIYCRFVGSNQHYVLGGIPDADGKITITEDFAYIAPRAFAGCAELKELSIGNSIFGIHIDEFAFANCYNLKKVSCRSDESDIIIEKNAFYTTLYNAENNGVIELDVNAGEKFEIGESAFEKGYKVEGQVCTSIKLENTIGGAFAPTKIGQSAFKGCKFNNSTSITLVDTASKPGMYSFIFADETFKIHISSDLLTTMQENWGWPLDQEEVLSLHAVADTTNEYQLYTYWPSIGVPTFERFGQAHVVVDL